MATDVDMQSQQQQNYNQHTVAQAPMMMDANVVAIQLDSSEIMDDVQHYLLSEKFNKQTGKWELQPGSTPLVSASGLNNLMAVVRSHLDKNHALTYYSEEMIFNILMLPLAEDLIFNIHNHWDDYSMDKRNGDIVLDIILNAVFASLMRSREGATLDMFKNIQRVTTNFDTANKRKGFLGLGLFAK